MLTSLACKVSPATFKLKSLSVPTANWSLSFTKPLKVMLAWVLPFAVSESLPLTLQLVAVLFVTTTLPIVTSTRLLASLALASIRVMGLPVHLLSVFTGASGGLGTLSRLMANVCSKLAPPLSVLRMRML